jgi:hypothetical protein
LDEKTKSQKTFITLKPKQSKNEILRQYEEILKTTIEILQQDHSTNERIKQISKTINEE